MYANARRFWSEGPEWGVWNAERSAEDKRKRAAKSDERVRFVETIVYSAASGSVSRVESVFPVKNPIYIHLTIGLSGKFVPIFVR